MRFNAVYRRLYFLLGIALALSCLNGRAATGKYLGSNGPRNFKKKKHKIFQSEGYSRTIKQVRNTRPPLAFQSLVHLWWGMYW